MTKEQSPRLGSKKIGKGIIFLSGALYRLDADYGDLSLLESWRGLKSKGITERDATAFRLRHGLSGEIPLTYKDIAQRLNISTARANQICDRVLRRLRHPVRLGKPSSRY